MSEQPGLGEKLDEIFCVKCGQLLSKVEVKASRYDWNVFSCPNRHLFEVGRPSGRSWSSGRWELREIEWVTCSQCGVVLPRLYFDFGAKAKVCPGCKEKERAAWMMDSEQSFAKVIVQPITTPEGLVYSFQSELTIRPYPNPFTFGGAYGGGTVKTTEEIVELPKLLQDGTAITMEALMSIPGQ